MFLNVTFFNFSRLKLSKVRSSFHNAIQKHKIKNENVTKYTKLLIYKTIYEQSPIPAKCCVVMHEHVCVVPSRHRLGRQLCVRLREILRSVRVRGHPELWHYTHGRRAARFGEVPPAGLYSHPPLHHCMRTHPWRRVTNAWLKWFYWPHNQQISYASFKWSAQSVILRGGNAEIRKYVVYFLLWNAEESWKSRFNFYIVVYIFLFIWYLNNYNTLKEFKHILSIIINKSSPCLYKTTQWLYSALISVSKEQ